MNTKELSKRLAALFLASGATYWSVTRDRSNEDVNSVKYYSQSIEKHKLDTLTQKRSTLKFLEFCEEN